jgi:hypothetical protein
VNFGALAFVEYASARNAARSIARSPGRLALWVLWGAILLTLIVVRVLEGRNAAVPAPIVSHYGALELIGFFAAMAGVSIAMPAAGWLQAFRSKAEARMLSSTGLRAQDIAVWLQLRAGTFRAAQVGTPLLCVLLGAGGHGASSRAVLGALLATAAGISIVAELPLPAFLLARRLGAAPLVIFGGCVALLGALCAVAGVAEHVDAPGIARLILHLLRFDPAPAAIWFLSGAPAALALAFAIPLLLLCAVAPLAQDALPDLYAVSMKSLELIESNRSGRVEAHADAAHAAAAHRTPPRFFTRTRTLLWSDWTTFKRTRGALVKWLAALIGSAALGGFVLFAERFGVDRSEADGLLGGLWALALIIPLMTSVSLADEISKPIWWLAPSALRERLTMWSIAHSWRGGVALGIGPTVLGIGSGDAALALGSLPLALAVWWFLGVLGVALYAAFPNKLDRSGPALFFRFLSIGALLVPLLTVFLAAIFLLHAGAVPHTVALACLATAGIAVGEAILLIEFAAYRIGRNAVGLALLERSA